MASSPPAADGSSSVPPDTAPVISGSAASGASVGRPADKKTAPLRLALLVAGLCLAILGGLGYFVFYPQLRAGYHWRQAKKALDNNDLARAQEHLESCANVWATDGEVHFLLARTCRRSGQMDKAKVHLKLAGKHGWVPEQIKLEYLLIKAQTGYRPDAVSPLQQWLKEGLQDDAYIFEALIIGCLQTNNFVEANRWATVWIEQHPDDWLGRFWLGAVLQAGGEYDLARQQYQTALELNPRGLDLHLRLAEMHMRANAATEAISHYQAALADDPDSTLALLGLARCQHSLGNSALARASLERLIELDLRNVEAYALYGHMALEEDKPQEALKFLNQAYAANPSHLITNKLLAQALRRLSRDDEAKEAERRAEELEKLYLRLDEIAKEALNLPKDVTLRYEAGSILLKLGYYEKAIGWLISALLIDPTHKPTKEATKKCLQRLGDPKLLELYRPVLDDQP